MGISDLFKHLTNHPDTIVLLSWVGRGLAVGVTKERWLQANLTVSLQNNDSYATFVQGTAGAVNGWKQVKRMGLKVHEDMWSSFKHGSIAPGIGRTSKELVQTILFQFNIITRLEQ